MVLEIGIGLPLEAGGLLDGIWAINEVEASWLPGVDTRDDMGHFRYRVRAVNTAATLLIQGDGETTDFELPEGADVTSTWPGGPVGYIVSDGHIIFDTPPTGTVAVGFIGAATPSVPSFADTWADLTTAPEPSPAGLDTTPSVDTTIPGTGERFIRTIIFRDLTVRDPATNHVAVYHDGRAFRVTAVLSKDITADCVIKIYKGFLGSPYPVELITFTVPVGTAVDLRLVFPAFGSPLYMSDGASPPSPILFHDGEIMYAAVVSSDGSQDVNGVLTVDVEWEPVP
jgi:hypothetical protein